MLYRLRELRKKAGLTQAQLARRAGVTQSYLSRLESSFDKAEHVTLSIIARLAKELDCEPAELIAYGIVVDERVKVMGEAQAGVWSEEPFWREERHYVTRTIADERFKGASRFGIEVATDEKNKRIAYCVPIEHIKGPLELGAEYVVQRRNEAGQYELTVRRLIKARDGSMWLELAECSPVDPGAGAPIAYHKDSPVVMILARVSSITQFR